jgi:uncharacterized protein
VRGMRVVKVVLVLAVVAALLLVLASAFQRRLVYFPDPTPAGPAAQALTGGQDLVLSTADGLELDAWFAPAEPSVDTGYAVLLAPGNGGHRGGRAPLAGELTERGLAVLLLDYRGYGGNPGSPTEDGVAADADAAVAALAGLGYPGDRVVYLGESLGTGVVAGLAARHRPAGVVLRSPFPELADVGATHYPLLPVGLILRDRFEVLAPLAEAGVPVTVVHGDADRVVPAQLSQQVADGLPALHEHLVLPGADHNDAVMFGPEVADAVVRLVQHLTQG